MCFIEWLKKDPSIFIELLNERNCLWQIKCKEYKNKVLRDMAIKTITEEMAHYESLPCLLADCRIMFDAT